MKEHGLTFNAPMVRAILGGAKTQTRRLRRLEEINEDPGRWTVEQDGLIDLPGAPYTGKRGVLFRDAGGMRVFIPARYSMDTIFWVREGWRLPVTLDELSAQDVSLRTILAKSEPSALPILYEADGARRNWNGDFEPGRHRHENFMPQWASRINLQYLGERVERLQDISEEDAIAEGVVSWRDSLETVSASMMHSPIECFARLWESIKGAGSWDANPWVWRISFKQHKERQK